MNKGIFITIEGPDGSGKSTQLEFIKEFMGKNNIDAIFTREPGGTQISEKIREIILDKNNRELEPMTEAMLYAASRTQLTRQLIIPALNEGKTVVCDRYVDSSLAYQQHARGLGDAVEVINGFATEGCDIDITFFLNVPPEIAMTRLKGSMDRIESEAMEFHEAVYAGYLAVMEKHPDRFVNIDATLRPDEVSRQIDNKLKEVFDIK